MDKRQYAKAIGIPEWEYEMLEEENLVPIRDDEKAIAKMNELLARDLDKERYSYPELLFLGKMSITKLGQKSKALQEEYMAL